jgi:hypothetical protein
LIVRPVYQYARHYKHTGWAWQLALDLEAQGPQVRWDPARGEFVELSPWAPDHPDLCFVDGRHVATAVAHNSGLLWPWSNKIDHIFRGIALPGGGWLNGAWLMLRGRVLPDIWCPSGPGGPPAP